MCHFETLQTIRQHVRVKRTIVVTHEFPKFRLPVATAAHNLHGSGTGIHKISKYFSTHQISATNLRQQMGGGSMPGQPLSEKLTTTLQGKNSQHIAGRLGVGGQKGVRDKRGAAHFLTFCFLRELKKSRLSDIA
jgi:hypothetical protein